VAYFQKNSKKIVLDPSMDLKQFCGAVASDPLLIESLHLQAFSNPLSRSTKPDVDVEAPDGGELLRSATTIAIVGGGLSGLTCAYHLIKKGYSGMF
jgi:hypothetical protein